MKFTFNWKDFEGKSLEEVSSDLEFKISMAFLNNGIEMDPESVFSKEDYNELAGKVRSQEKGNYKCKNFEVEIV